MFDLEAIINSVNEASSFWNNTQAIGLILAFISLPLLAWAIIRGYKKELSEKSEALNTLLMKIFSTVTILSLGSALLGNFMTFSKSIDAVEEQAPTLQSWLHKEYDLEISTDEAEKLLKDAGLLETPRLGNRVSAGSGVPSGLVTVKDLRAPGAPDTLLEWRVVSGKQLIFTELDNQGQPVKKD